MYLLDLRLLNGTEGLLSILTKIIFELLQHFVEGEEKPTLQAEKKV